MIEKILKIGNISVKNGILLAPMEGITDLPFRVMCRKYGSDIVYSEFIASEALIRDVRKSKDKIRISDSEHPVAIQIFGSNPAAMAESARIAEEAGADILDINYGCWVKKVVNNNAGAALLKDPQLMFDITKACVEAVKIPVTVKTRLGWDKNSIIINEVAKMQEQAGAQAITVHCRTRDMGMSGKADWSYIPEIKKGINIPLILNGDIQTPEDSLNALSTEGADAVMIGRSCVGNPFIFKNSHQLIDLGIEPKLPDAKERIIACKEHLSLSIDYRQDTRAILEFRKHYSGYLRGLFNASPIRQKLVALETKEEIFDLLDKYYDFLVQEDRLMPQNNPEIPKVTCRKS